jgi:Ca2+/Na+ antiporter
VVQGLEHAVGVVVTLVVFGLGFVLGLAALVRGLEHGQMAKVLMELLLVALAAWLVYSAAVSAMPWAFR